LKEKDFQGSPRYMYPIWLTDLAWAYIALCFICVLIILIDLANGHRHRMAVMNWVWPITALYFGPIAVVGHFKESRAAQATGGHDKKPFWAKVFVGATHCGSGCVLGDFIGEWIVFLTGITIAGSMLWANYAFDFGFAYLFGIVFQYFSIAPMRNISGWPGIWAAVKADTVSLTAFEVGMFVWMWFTHAVLFPGLKPTTALYWFMMQIAMVVGFATTYPANWLLIRKGFKETM
jgi:hypothetical protein